MSKRKPKEQIETQAPPPPPSAAVKPARKAVVEQVSAEETHQGPSFGEAAGLISPQETPEPAPAPWAGSLQSGQPFILPEWTKKSFTFQHSLQDRVLSVQTRCVFANYIFHQSWNGGITSNLQNGPKWNFST